MKRLAFVTFAILKKPFGNIEIEQFTQWDPLVGKSVTETEGLIRFNWNEQDPAIIKSVVETHQKTYWDLDWGSWGEYKCSRFYEGSRKKGEVKLLQTLSLWENIESVYVFSYYGLHGQAFKERRSMVQDSKGKWPSYVAWWIEEGQTPTWSDACERLESLFDKQSTSFAFDFKTPFDSDGNKIIDFKKADSKKKIDDLTEKMLIRLGKEKFLEQNSLEKEELVKLGELGIKELSIEISKKIEEKNAAHSESSK